MAYRLAAIVIVGACLTVGAQSVRFEVASIKRNTSGTPGYARVEPGARFTAVNVPPLQLIRQAYGVQTFTIVNLPDWTRSDGYDVLAKAPDGTEVMPNMAALLKNLLADRFGFAAHTETREMPTYDLTLARSDGRLGAKMTRATVDCTGNTSGAPPALSASGEPLCGVTGGPGRIVVRGFPIGVLASVLASPLQRMVVDKTGLGGTWNLEIQFTPDQPASLNGAVVTPSPDAPSLFTAVQEQLGLKLESSRGPVEALVIDRIARPTTD